MLVGLLSANTTGCSFTSAQARSTAWWGEVAGWAPSSEGREGLRVYPHLIKGGGHGADADEDGRFDRFHDVHQRLHLRCFVRKVALCVGGGRMVSACGAGCGWRRRTLWCWRES